MGLLVYFPLLYIHIKLGGKAIYYAIAATALPFVELFFSFRLSGGFDIMFLLIFNVMYFHILGRIRNPIYYVLFALIGGGILLILVAIIRTVLLNLLGIPLEDM